MATDVIPQDGVYEDKTGSRFQFRKDHVLPPGGLALLKRVGDFPQADEPGMGEFGQTLVPAEDADANAKADAEAKAKADADAKAAPKPENKADVPPQNKQP